MPKNKVVFLSDIHIGTNSPTVWYQKDLHEPYLISVLDWVIRNASDIRELIFLGDIVDFWTYPCKNIPPTFRDIVEANPNIFGDNSHSQGRYGKLSDVLTALEGKVSYVRGNHDMTITQEDMNEVKNPIGYNIKLQDDIYFPLGKDNPKLVCTHGHRYTMFNAPYSKNNHITPLPLGYYITRSVASLRDYGVQKNEFNRVADLQNSGDPNFLDKSMLNSILEIFGTPLKLATNPDCFSISRAVLAKVSEITGISDKEPIMLKLANGSSVITTIEEAKRTYENLFTEWREREGGGEFGLLTATKSAYADLDGSYMGWFAQRLAFETGADLVVMGHTHKPIFGLEASSIGYVNTGFNCPSAPDIGKKHPTFIVVDHTKINSGKGTVAQYAEILQADGMPEPKVYKAEPTKVADAVASQDCSCYVEIDNTKGTSDLIRENYTKEHGHYVVAPPQKIARGQIARFWLQDPPGSHGAEGGEVRYRTESGQTILFKYSCPFGSPSMSNLWNYNLCSVDPKEKIKFYKTRTNGHEDWGNEDEVKESGHPFFVKFVL